MKKQNTKIFSIIIIFIIIVYLWVDYTDILNKWTFKINFECFGIIMNAIVLIWIFVITYNLVDSRTIENEISIKQNKLNVLDVLLEDVCRECKNTIELLDNNEMIINYLIPKIDFKSTNDQITERLKNNPFKNEKYIFELFISGVVENKYIDTYVSVKSLYHEYVNLKVIAFDAKEQRNELYEVINYKRDFLLQRIGELNINHV